MSDNQASNLFVNDKGFVYAEGTKICRLTSDGKLEFVSKGNRNSRRRGDKITIRPADLVRLAVITAPPPVRPPASASDATAPPASGTPNNPR